MHKYIITGGPGSGKTSLIETLHESGYSCSPEASRQLIMEELLKGSGCLPWLDLHCFAGKALERMTTLYHASAENRLTFFDRGLPDIIAYLRVGGFPVAEKYGAALLECPYNKTVFLLPPWSEIYVQDPARWQTFGEAETIYRHIKATYLAAGYQLKELPRSSVNERMKFVLKNINYDEKSQEPALPKPISN
jgi:predicted ATPase